MNSRIYFALSLLVLPPIGITSAFLNSMTLDVMVSTFPGYPDVICLDTYTPDRALVSLHQLGYSGVLTIVGLFVAVIAGVTFLLRKEYANKINFALLIAGIYFAVFSLAWVCMPMVVLSKWSID